MEDKPNALSLWRGCWSETRLAPENQTKQGGKITPFTTVIASSLVTMEGRSRFMGGVRPNSGPQKGAKYAKTIAREQAREIARQIITEKLESLLETQIANETGVSHFLMRDPVTQNNWPA
jgi:hypothetical protein